MVGTVPTETIEVASLDSCTPTLVLLADTAGVFSLIAVVGCGPHGFFLLRAKVPDWLLRQFVPRSDDPIGVQEALAVWRLVTSFKKLLGGASTRLCRQ